jgi:hypothetical protein
MSTFCAFDDRSTLVGLKLLVLSLEKYCRDFVLYLGYVEKNEELHRWLKRHGPHVVPVRMAPFAHICLKHIKPLLFLELFQRGVEDAVWLDTDIMVLRDLEPAFRRFGDKTVVVTQDINPFQPQKNLRAHYRMSPVRELSGCVNSCVARFTRHHRPLLEKWLEFMRDPVFLKQWNLPPHQRLWGFGLDQTVLQLLLCCQGQGWTPPEEVALLRDGPEIIQEWGVRTYRLRDRLGNTLGLNRPLAIHLIGYEKPWTIHSRVSSHRWACVYSTLARPYRNETEEDMSWIEPATLGTRLAGWLSFGQPHLVGVWHTLAAKIWHLLRPKKLKFNDLDQPRIAAKSEVERADFSPSP